MHENVRANDGSEMADGSQNHHDVENLMRMSNEVEFPRSQYLWESETVYDGTSDVEKSFKEDVLQLDPADGLVGAEFPEPSDDWDNSTQTESDVKHRSEWPKCLGVKLVMQRKDSADGS